MLGLKILQYKLVQIPTHLLFIKGLNESHACNHPLNFSLIFQQFIFIFELFSLYRYALALYYFEFFNCNCIFSSFPFFFKFMHLPSNIYFPFFFFNFRDILFLISISSFLSCFESFTFVISNSSTPSLALIFNLHMLSFQFNAIYLFSVYVFKHFNLFYSLLAFFPILFFFIYDFFS